SLANTHDVEIASLEQSQPEPALPLRPEVTITPTRTEEALTDYLSARGGVLIGTRPEINVLIAQHRGPGTIAIGQDHFHLAHYDHDRRALMQQWYPRLDAHVSLTEGDADAYRLFFGEPPPSVSIPNAVHDPGDVRADLNSKIVVAAGRLTRQKGYDLLLR